MVAIAISVSIHTLIFGGYELNKMIRLIPKLPSWLAAAKQPVRVQQEEQPLEFVTVPSPSTEAPKEAKYYSNKNAVASDNSQNKDTENPELNGKQKDIPQTQDIPRPQFSKSPNGDGLHQEASAEASQQAQPKPSSNSGDLTLGKPDNTTEQEQPRPRTLKEAYAAMANRMPSLTMNESGGVHHHARVPSLNVKITGFGDYDERFAETVNQNWWNLLDSQRFADDRTGKVVLLFRLNADGTISQLRFAENTVGDLLGYVCEKAILDGAPYERWSEDMRLKLGDHYDVQYTFGYY